MKCVHCGKELTLEQARWIPPEPLKVLAAYPELEGHRGYSRRWPACKEPCLRRKVEKGASTDAI